MTDAKNAEATVEAEVVEYGIGAATDVAGAIEGLNNPDAAFYSSMKNDTFEGRVAVAQALSVSKPVADNLNTEIMLKHFIVQSVQISDDETGEVNEAPRVTLVDADGNAFHGTSIGLLSAVRNLIAQVGDPNTWEQPLRVSIVEERGRRGYRYQTIKLLGV
jgi:hypothetical protein